jgi:hypothetical protein
MGEAMEFLDPEHSVFARNEAGTLRLQLDDGVVYDNVHCRPMFPLSDPHGFLAVMVAGEDGGKCRQVAVIRDLAGLPKSQRNLVREDLKLAHFLPEIVQIRSIRRCPGAPSWQVVTDSGERTFVLKNPRENTAVTAAGVHIVTDEHQVRYRITAMDTLDRRSRQELEKAEF